MDSIDEMCDWYVVEFQDSEGKTVREQYNLKDVESTIRDISESVMRKIVGTRPFDKVIKEGRQSISSEAKTLIRRSILKLKQKV